MCMYVFYVTGKTLDSVGDCSFRVIREFANMIFSKLYFLKRTLITRSWEKNLELCQNLEIWFVRHEKGIKLGKKIMTVDQYLTK